MLSNSFFSRGSFYAWLCRSRAVRHRVPDQRNLHSTIAVFSPLRLLLAGLACLAPHLSGVGTGWTGRKRGIAADRGPLRGPFRLTET